MATVLEAMEQGKVNAGVTPDFDDFVKNYTQEVDSDISDKSDDEEDTVHRFARATVDELRKEFCDFIKNQKKPKLKDCTEFATKLSNENPGEDFSPQEVRDRVWVIIRQEQKKIKTAEKKAKKSLKKPKRKPSKRKKSQEEEDDDDEEEPQPSTSKGPTPTKKKKKRN